jgi:small subunit ribosomal protein S17
MSTSSKIKRILEGVVVSNRMAKTAVVAVTRQKMNKKYQKYFKVTERYKAQADEDYQIGDRVRIIECRPLSKDKKWRILEKISVS